MSKFFERTSSHWVKYSEYVYRHDKDGVLYLTPKPKAKPLIIDLIITYGL